MWSQPCYGGSMATTSGARKRTRGEIETLPSGSLRVRVYAGLDPVSKKKHYLVETVPAGPTAANEAEKVRTRLLNQVDERRNPRTKATLNQLLDRWLEVVELEPTTRSGLAALGTLVITLSQSPVLAAIVAAISNWLGQRRQRTVKLDIDGDVLQLSGVDKREIGRAS